MNDEQFKSAVRARAAAAKKRRKAIRTAILSSAAGVIIVFVAAVSAISFFGQGSGGAVNDAAQIGKSGAEAQPAGGSAEADDPSGNYGAIVVMGEKSYVLSEEESAKLLSALGKMRFDYISEEPSSAEPEEGDLNVDPSVGEILFSIFVKGSKFVFYENGVYKDGEGFSAMDDSAEEVKTIVEELIYQ